MQSNRYTTVYIKQNKVSHMKITADSLYPAYLSINMSQIQNKKFK